MTADFGSSATVCGSKRGIRNRLAHLAARSFFIVASILTGSVFFLTGGGAADASREQNIADAAEKLIGDIRETHYQHKTYVVQRAGIYYMDCSGFVDYLLKRVAPEQYAVVPVETGHPRARAAMYFDLFHGLLDHPVAGWKSIERLADARRGDIIAWALEASTPKPGDTGHVVIVAAPPVQAGGSEYRVQVYDSSGIHHDDDTRPKGTNGIGEGVILFKVDDRGVPIGFRFNSHAHPHLEPIAVGRIVQ
jgi:hypothetical protein